MDQPDKSAKRVIPLIVLAVIAAYACGGPRRSYMPPRVAARGSEEVVYSMQSARAEASDAEYAPSDARRPAGQAFAAPSPEQTFNREQYDHTPETGFRVASEQPLSTFSADVDTASYSNVRRFLQGGQRPPIDAVRIEELLNYFSYESPHPAGPGISIASEVADSPFAASNKLVRIGLRASAPADGDVIAKRLVFLIDVSGSMADANKLPLLKKALLLLVPQLKARDQIAIVTYAGASGVALGQTPGDDHATIASAIEALESGGSTNGAAGIELAYQLAAESCTRGAICRVVLATDGDFNVGISDRGSLVRLIERKRDAGIFLTVLGFGMGNLQDATMEELADKGNGSYAYIDTLREARKVLVEQANATLRTVAKDTKIQVEFNPARVARYRLLGYENRRLHDEDFNDDKKDAGEMGDGQSVTALYELELRDARAEAAPQIDPLKYQAERAQSAAARSDELMTIKVRYKTPDANASQLVRAVVRARSAAFPEASPDLRFAAAVAGFGMLLRESPYAGALRLADVDRIARTALGPDRDGYRHDFLELVAQAQQLASLHRN
jgi:Ca-activated chloride channel family protein